MLTHIFQPKNINFILSKSISGAVIILDDYGGWRFTDGITKFGNEIKQDKKLVVVPNHLGQLIIYKI